MKQDQTSGNEGNSLGFRVRNLRKSHGLTLDVLSKKSGISRASISKIERGEMSPTYATLRKLANGLEIALTSLVMEAETVPKDAFRIVRAGEGQQYGNPLYKYERLPGLPGVPGETIHISELVAGEIAEFPELHAHATHDFFYVLSGTVAAHFEGEAEQRLEAGDSLTFDGRKHHAFTDAGKGPDRAKLLWISRPR